jgi:Tol biopolymer transport system component
LALVPSAAGTFPGANGRIVFSSNRRADLQPQIFAVPVAGGSVRNVSRRPSYVNDAPDARAGALVYASGPYAGFGRTSIWLVTQSGARRLVVGSTPLLSPDGSRVVGVDQDGLFVVEVRGGAKRRLSDVGSSGAWSPDGRWIAYVDANGVELVRPDSSERRTFPTLYPQLSRAPWSPDGTRLVVESDGRIVVVDVATGRETVLARGFQPAWSPDGNRIAFVQDDAIATVRPNGGDLTELTTPATPTYTDSSPQWAPDSRAVAYLRTHHLDDGAESWLGIAAGLDDTRYPTPIEGHLVGAFAWSGDGRAIYYSSRSLRDVFHLFTVGPHLRGVRQLTRGAGDDRQPVWAPDGRRIAFVQNGASLVVLDRGRERVVAQQAGLSSPTWSPDCHRLAYAAGGAVWVADVRHPGRRRLVAGTQPAWSPTGSWIAYVHGGLRLVRADGTGDHWLKADDEELLYGSPTWSPRGTVLYYDAVGRCSGFCVPDEGTLRAVRPFAVPIVDIRIPAYTGKPAVSPDGRFFVFPGLSRTPVSGIGASFAATSYATDVEPDWQRLTARPMRRRARATSG